jgi:hypothetical protein
MEHLGKKHNLKEQDRLKRRELSIIIRSELAKLKAKPELDIEYIHKSATEPMPKKQRSDKGSTRAKYDPSIPMKMRSYIGRANKKGIAFELTIEQFNQLCSSACAYCNGASNIGIDRKDSSIGYVIDNCQPACGKCNMMKYTFDEDSFLQQILRIYKHRLI